MRQGRRKTRSHGSADPSESDLCLALELPVAGWSPPTGSRQTCSGTLWGKGILEAAAAHFKVSSIIHGDLEEMSASLEQPCSHTLQDGSSLLLCLFSMGTLVSSRNKGATGKAGSPSHALPDPSGE